MAAGKTLGDALCGALYAEILILMQYLRQQILAPGDFKAKFPNDIVKLFGSKVKPLLTEWNPKTRKIGVSEDAVAAKLREFLVGLYDDQTMQAKWREQTAHTDPRFHFLVFFSQKIEQIVQRVFGMQPYTREWIALLTEISERNKKIISLTDVPAAVSFYERNYKEVLPTLSRPASRSSVGSFSAVAGEADPRGRAVSEPSVPAAGLGGGSSGLPRPRAETAVLQQLSGMPVPGPGLPAVHPSTPAARPQRRSAVDGFVAVPAGMAGAFRGRGGGDDEHEPLLQRPDPAAAAEERAREEERAKAEVARRVREEERARAEATETARVEARKAELVRLFEEQYAIAKTATPDTVREGRRYNSAHYIAFKELLRQTTGVEREDQRLLNMGLQETHERADAYALLRMIFAAYEAFLGERSRRIRTAGDRIEACKKIAIQKRRQLGCATAAAMPSDVEIERQSINQEDRLDEAALLRLLRLDEAAAADDGLPSDDEGTLLAPQAPSGSLSPQRRRARDSQAVRGEEEEVKGGRFSCFFCCCGGGR